MYLLINFNFHIIWDYVITSMNCFSLCSLINLTVAEVSFSSWLIHAHRSVKQETLGFSAALANNKTIEVKIKIQKF